MDIYLKETPLLNFNHRSLIDVVKYRDWNALPEDDRIGQVYDFVQNEIAFGYNEADNIPASKVLSDGWVEYTSQRPLAADNPVAPAVLV